MSKSAPPPPSDRPITVAHERLTLWLDVLKWAIPAISAAILVPVLNWQFQDAELRQDAQLRQFELNLKKQEIEGIYLAQFVTHALTKDYETKVNFAHYFATLTVNEELKKNWAKYYADVVKQKDANIAELASKDKLRLEAKQERDMAQARIEELSVTIEGLTQAGSDSEALQEKLGELEQARIQIESYRSSIEKLETEINRLNSQTFSSIPLYGAIGDMFQGKIDAILGPLDELRVIRHIEAEIPTKLRVSSTLLLAEHTSIQDFGPQIRVYRYRFTNLSNEMHLLWIPVLKFKTFLRPKETATLVKEIPNVYSQRDITPIKITLFYGREKLEIEILFPATE